MGFMVLFWVLQGLLDVALVALAVSYVIQRRRLLALEGQLRAAISRLEGGSYGLAPAALSEAALNTPLGAALSTLSERRASSSDSEASSLSTSGRYTLAQKMLSEGHSLGDVAKRTGISQTELVLLRKLAQSSASKNYEAH